VAGVAIAQAEVKCADDVGGSLASASVETASVKAVDMGKGLVVDILGGSCGFCDGC
jgi:hypothetical protein